MSGGELERSGGGRGGSGGDRCCCCCCTPNMNRCCPEVPLPPLELDLLLSKYVLFHMYLLKAVTGLGYLALTWSTVVLLGGFITALTKKDFWCITIISLMQAARIFHDLADQLLPNFFKLVTHIIGHNYAILRYRLLRVAESVREKKPVVTVAARAGPVAFVGLAVLPFLALCYVPAFLYVYGGPVACIALAILRTVQRDYDDDDGDGSNNGKANLVPALDMFYSLVLLQGGLLLVWLYHESWWVDHLITLRQVCKLPDTDWCRRSLVEFLSDTRARCWRDLSSIRGRKLVDYAVGLLDDSSGGSSWEDNLSAARLLDEFIRQGRRRRSDEVRSLLLPSRSKIQKLIDSLGWRDGRRDDGEMRRLAARIVAHLAGDLHLSQFPGAIHCISYLLQDEATLAYIDQQQQAGLTTAHAHVPHRRIAPEKLAMILRLQRREARRRKKHTTRRAGAGAGTEEADGDGDGSSGGGVACNCNELILQGLAILERLACDRNNCGEICGSPGLLAKITAPLYSGTLVQDIQVVTNDDWVAVVNATFKVVYQLMHAPGESSTRLRAEISENEQAMSNLEAILRLDAQVQQELQMRAIEILTELALDSSIDLPRATTRTLMRKQMHVFLNADADDGDLRATAGRTLALTKCGDETSIDALVRLLDDEDIVYRMIAAEILENICLHCDKQPVIVKEILLPKVLSKIMPSEGDNTKRGNSAVQTNDENNRNPALGHDEENQNSSTQGVNAPQIPETPSSRNQKKSSDQGNEGQTAAKALQAKLLSLTLVMYVKLESADFDIALPNNDSALFVAELKTMVVDNCRQATLGSLNIVKLCGQIAVSMMQSNQYTEHFQNQEFVKSLSEARKIMSNIESCVLFVGTGRDHGLRKMARPLLLDLENEAQRLVGELETSL